MIRSHAAWALSASLGLESVPELEEMRRGETVPETLDELDQTIEELV